MAFHVHKGDKTSPFRKEKERISRRFQTNLEAIIAKYNRPFSGSDVLDLNDMTVVEDQGFLGGMKKQKIGTVRLAVDKATSHLYPGPKWNSTKDSTDSAFGSTRYSESEDTSGTETIANYSFQATRFASDKEAENANSRLEDVWMGSDCHSEDSGNEDVESDHSGPICTPSKTSLHSPSYRQRKPEAVRDSMPLSTHRSSRGNLSRRFEAEEEAERKGKTSRVLSLDDEESEDEDNDPYEFREEELPSILEEKNRFLSKMQSILVESFIDGDDIDEMESQTDDDEASTETIDSSEVTSASISAWSTLPSKTPTKRSSKPLRKREELKLDNGRQDTPAERRVLSSTDSDITECSTILAGNLHSERVVFHPSHLLHKAKQHRDCVRNEPSQPPFQAICNSTMLSDINPPEEAVPETKSSQQSRGLELPLEGQKGEMCLGEVPLNGPPELKPQTLDEQVTRTPRRGKDTKPTTSAKSVLPSNSREGSRGKESSSDGDLGKTVFRTPSTKKQSKEDGIKTLSQDTSGITPRAKLRKGPGRQSPISLSSPRFDTKEIMEIFRSPKPLIIPGVDLKDLDLTPRRRVKQEGIPTPTRSLRDALRNLHSPTARKCPLGSQTAKEIRPRSNGSADETVLGCANLDSTDLSLEKSEAVHLEGSPSAARGKPNVDDDKDDSFEDVKMISPEVHCERRRSPRLKGDNPAISGQGKSVSLSELPKKPVQRILTLMHANPAVSQRSKSKTVKPDDQRHNSRSDHADIAASLPESRDTRTNPLSQQRKSQDSTKQPSSSGKLQVPIKMHRPSRSARDSNDSDSDSQVLPASKQPAARQPAARQPASRKIQHTVEKSLQHAKPERQSSREQGLQKKTQTTPVSTKTPSLSRRVDNGPVTPIVRNTPSKLSSPLNQLSLSTPHKFYNKKKDKLPEDYVARPSDQMKDKGEAGKQVKSKLVEGNLRSKSWKSGKAKLDATHMTIRPSDDDSEEEMEVDPYSLTADDSSPGPLLYHRRLQLDPKEKPNTKSKPQGGRQQTKITSNKESVKLMYSSSKGNLQSTQSKDLNTDGQKSGIKNTRESKSSNLNNRVPLTGSSRTSHNPRNSENLINSRGSDGSSRSAKASQINKEQNKVRSWHKSNPSSPPPSPIYQSEDSPRLSRLDQQKKSSASLSKAPVRREHSQYFSDEECNSSDDSAKFISMKSSQRELRTKVDPSRQPDAWESLKNRKMYHTDDGIRSKHKTTIRCGQIITTPTKDLHRTCSPSHKGRVEKTRKHYPTSPIKTYQTEIQMERGSSKKPSQSDHVRMQNLKTTVGTVMASPTSRHGNVRTMETSRSDISSPLRASGCNVSSSYVCEGPGHCTKPFCFNCALSEIS